jgi:putative redox protein
MLDTGKERAMTVFSATLNLGEGAAFEAVSGSGHRAVLDSPEVTGGGNSGFRPLEMLLLGVGGCAGMVTTALLRRMRQEVTAYEVKLQGNRAESHPMVFTDIAVEHVFTGRALDAAAVRQALSAACNNYSPVVIMVGKATTITHTYRLIDADTGEEQSGTL